LTAAWAGLKTLPASIGYEVEADFRSMPKGDEALTKHLLAEPGMTRVVVGTRAGEPNTLVVIFVIVRNSWGRPPLPDIDAICRELGYDAASRFRPCVRSETISGR
jgi:hypothetical protein